MTPSDQNRTLPCALDTSKPNVAGAYDYLFGGKDHFAADRELAERLLAIYPGARQMVRENRWFLARALNSMPGQAISRYVDLGAGLPTRPAVHDIVRRQDTAAAVLYVDNDPMVISHLQALACTSGSRVEALTADLAASAAVLGHAREAGLADLDEPVCLILAMALHFYPAADARNLVAEYAGELARGSYVIITVRRGQETIGQQITRAYDAATLYNHGHDEVVSFFPGLDLIPPGITDARAWTPGWATPAPFHDRAGQVLGSGPSRDHDQYRGARCRRRPWSSSPSTGEGWSPDGRSATPLVRRAVSCMTAKLPGRAATQGSMPAALMAGSIVCGAR